MSVPSLGGLQIFGTAVTMQTSQRIRAKQINAFFGLSGLETLDGGARGYTTHVAGYIAGSGPSGLTAAQAAFRVLNDGLARTLIDTTGTVWPGVVLQSFLPHGRIGQSPQGDYFQAYEAILSHDL